MALEVNETESGGGTLLTAKGEVDLSTAPQLRDAILKAVKKAGGPVSVSLAGVSYMDSSGVATLVEGLKACRETSKEFKLVAPSQSVMKVLQLSRLDSVFTITESA